MSARKLLFRAPFTRCPHDEAAGNPRAVVLQDALQAGALIVARNLARHAHVIHGRHVDQETAGQGDVGSDARALLAERAPWRSER